MNLRRAEVDGLVLEASMDAQPAANGWRRANCPLCVYYGEPSEDKRQRWASARRASRRHKINFDAIREGARALLRSWPDEPPGPTSIPPRVHRVLWEDDYWRGVTMMGEACKRAFQAETEDVGSRAENAMAEMDAVDVLLACQEEARAIAEAHRRQKTVCAAVGGGLPPKESSWTEDQLDVLSACWSQLSATGCIERYGPAVPAAPDDVEAEADVREEA